MDAINPYAMNPVVDEMCTGVNAGEAEEDVEDENNALRRHQLIR